MITTLQCKISTHVLFGLLNILFNMTLIGLFHLLSKLNVIQTEKKTENMDLQRPLLADRWTVCLLNSMLTLIDFDPSTRGFSDIKSSS